MGATSIVPWTVVNVSVADSDGKVTISFVVFFFVFTHCLYWNWRKRVCVCMCAANRRVFVNIVGPGGGKPVGERFRLRTNQSGAIVHALSTQLSSRVGFGSGLWRPPPTGQHKLQQGRLLRHGLFRHWAGTEGLHGALCSLRCTLCGARKETAQRPFILLHVSLSC